MFKKVFSLLVAVCIVFSCFASCLAKDDASNKEKLNYITVYVPYDGEYNWQNEVKARYTDTKEPISLSQQYDGRVYAIIPAFNSHREIEAFTTQETEFTDYSINNYEYYTFKYLSRTGIITGNEKGEARPFDNITRAEATTILMRAIGLNNMPFPKINTVFKDVSQDDWFYPVVMRAYNCGIIEGDSKDTFAPQRNVTREEIAVMAARAVNYAGLGYPGDKYFNVTDLNKVSSWAQDAYKIIGSYTATDYDDTDPENPKRVINPQKYATRFDVADTFRNIIDYCVCFPSQKAMEYGFDKQMPVIDGSTSTYPFTEAVYNSLFYNGGNHPSKPISHSKSHATYQRLINGEIDIMFASVYPASDILKMAQDKGVELELIPIAYDAMIFFTNKDNPVKGLTSEQISNIYVNNAYSNWNQVGGSDALLYPYCRNNDSGSHAQMEKHFLKGNQIHETIQKETTSIAMASVLTDVIDAKTDNPLGYGLGYSIYYYYHNADMVLGTKQHLKLLSIDGVEPNDDTIADGSYPLSNNTYAVIRKDSPENSYARKMADFMLTEKGQECVESAGFGKLRK